MFCENSTGTEIEQISLGDVKDQYKFIVDRLKGEKSLNGIAVLYRNNDSAIPIVDALIRENIPFTIRGCFQNTDKHAKGKQKIQQDSSIYQ